MPSIKAAEQIFKTFKNADKINFCNLKLQALGMFWSENCPIIILVKAQRSQDTNLAAPVYGSIACIKYAFALYVIMQQFMNVFS